MSKTEKQAFEVIYEASVFFFEVWCYENEGRGRETYYFKINILDIFQISTKMDNLSTDVGSRFAVTVAGWSSGLSEK